MSDISPFFVLTTVVHNVYIMPHPKLFFMNKKHIVASAYTEELFDKQKFKKMIQDAKKFIQEKTKETGVVPTGLISTGISGNTFATVLAYELDLDVVIVRKAGESSHANKTVEGLSVGRGVVNRLIIVDDFICSGDTIKRIISTVNKLPDNYGYDLSRNEYVKPNVEFLYGILYRSYRRYTVIDDVDLYGIEDRVF